MLKKGITTSLIFIIASVLFIAACDVISEKGLEDSLDVVPNVQLIEGAENASIRVNKGSNSHFNIDIQNVEWNNLISNGEKPAWCIAWDTPISSNNTSYDGIGIYSAKNDKQFEPINRLFTIKSQLLKADPEITWREIQVAIWSLLDHPQFDMYDTENLPNEVKSNGQPNFDHSKVEDIISVVKGNSASKLLASSESNDLVEKTVCILVTEGDTQTVIVECDDTAYAYGGIFEADYSGYAGDDDDEIATCFPSVEEANENKWGWTNGALEPGEYNWPMYAGAGGCILNKGTNVGSLNVDFFQDGNSYTAEVTFNLNTSYYDISGYDFTSLLHLYVGSTETPPSGNFAPGNYYVEGNENYYDQQIISQDNDNLTVTYEVTGLPAEIWVIGHIGG